MLPAVVVPSPQSMEHECVSAVPGSAKAALTATGLPSWPVVPGAGAAIVTDGGTFRTVTVAVSTLSEPEPSVTRSPTVKIPS